MQIMVNVNEKHIESLRMLGIDPECAMQSIFRSLHYHIRKEAQGYDLFKEEHIEEIINDLAQNCRKLKEEQIKVANKGRMKIKDLEDRRNGEEGKFKRKK